MVPLQKSSEIHVPWLLYGKLWYFQEHHGTTIQVQNITVVGYHVQKTFFVSKKIPKFSMALPCFGGNIIVKRCHNPPKNIVNVSDRTLSKSTVMVQKWHKMVIP